MSEIQKLIKKLEACLVGQAGWKDFENACIEILSYIFIPSLEKPKIQKRTLSGIDRRDAVFPNRNFSDFNIWGKLYQELNARMILFEFKNYDNIEIGKDEVEQVWNYLRKPWGRLAFIIGSKMPNRSAYQKRNTVYSDDGTVILFLNKEHLKEMLYIKERGEDPADLIIDLVEEFYLEYE